MAAFGWQDLWMVSEEITFFNTDGGSGREMEKRRFLADCGTGAVVRAGQQIAGSRNSFTKDLI